MRDQLPQSDGAGDQMDVFGGYVSVDALSGKAGHAPQYGRISENRRQGNPQASEFYPCPRQQCRPQYPRHQQGAGTVCTGKPVRFPRFR